MDFTKNRLGILIEQFPSIKPFLGMGETEVLVERVDMQLLACEAKTEDWSRCCEGTYDRPYNSTDIRFFNSNHQEIGRVAPYDVVVRNVPRSFLWIVKWTSEEIVRRTSGETVGEALNRLGIADQVAYIVLINYYPQQRTIDHAIVLYPEARTKVLIYKLPKNETLTTLVMRFHAQFVDEVNAK